ncbi:MAG TPA: hypothetical protein VGR71_16945 [Nitrospira sp.]|nr:hypothetical protein [Nitrospira sp.]
MSQPEPEPWEPPIYQEVRFRAGYVDMQCQRCGAFVGDLIVHNRHHRALDQLRDGVVALTRILVPGLPEDTILSSLGNAEDIHWTGVFPPGLIPGGAGPDSSVHISGGEGGLGAIGGTFGGITIGRGGGGNNPLIPECPVCGAYGGGGHGGGCPNSGRPIDQWVSS